MTVPLMALPLSAPIPGPGKKKRVLLVDISTRLRDLRSETMRRLGMDVDCAADISEARCWWRAGLYDLVLVNAGDDLRQRDRFCDDIRGATPPQQLAFLVGKPEYLAHLPNGNGNGFADESIQAIAAASDEARLSAIPRDPHQRWGILEASRLISAVRSAAHARTKALRDRPLPSRDLEARAEKRSLTLDELLREEMQ